MSCPALFTALIPPPHRCNVDTNIELATGQTFDVDAVILIVIVRPEFLVAWLLTVASMGQSAAQDGGILPSSRASRCSDR